MWRATELSEEDQRTLDRVEEYGCSVILVTPGDSHAGWGYTLGVFDTAGQPEIVTVGLKTDTAHAALNAAAAVSRNGVELTQGRHREILGGVECEFRPVDKKWIPHLMGWAEWYYQRSPFPVLQLVYPDLENRFPNEPGFDEAFAQPLLQSDATWGSMQANFWAATDPNWKFKDGPHTGVFVSTSVHQRTEDITFASHDLEDGAWQFLGDSMSDGVSAQLVCFHHIIDNDPTVAELSDLPLGWYAERESVGAPWIRREKPPQQEEPDLPLGDVQSDRIQ